jgi:ABC-type lipoprotein export system ATPase subunit
MSDENISLVVDKISKNYIMESSVLTVLVNFSLIVARGESGAVNGPSGSGKTTLLNIIGGLDRPDEGRVTVDGENIADFTEPELAGYRNSKVGFVFQDHLLLPQCTLIENVLIPALPSTSNAIPEERMKRANMLIERVGLKGRLKHFPHQLSGGEKQRTALVRALINEPSIILADEPTGSLDRDRSEDLVNLLNEINCELKVTLILATHSELVAQRMDRHISLA